MNKIFEILLKYYRTIGIVLILLFFVSSYYVAKNKIDNSIKIWFLPEDPVFVNYMDFQKKYGNDDVVAVLISYDKNILDKKIITDLVTVENKLKQLTYVDKINTFASSQYLLSNEEGIKVESVVTQIPKTDEELESIKKRLSSFPKIAEIFLAQDQKSLIISIRLKQVDLIEEKRDFLISGIKTELNKVYPEYKLGGLAVFNDALNNAVTSESALFTSLSYLLIAIFLLFTLRKKSFMILALIAILFPIVYTFGIFQATGHQINLMSMIIPTLVMVCSIGDIVHIVNYYYCQNEIYPDLPKNEIIVKSLTYTFVPCLFTTITTAIGFFAITFSPMDAIKETGWFAAIGVLLELIVAYLVAIIGFAIMPKPKLTEMPKYIVFFQSINKRIISFFILLIHKYRYFIWTLAAALIIGSALVISKIEINTYPIEYLSKDNIARKDNLSIEKIMGGCVPLELIIASNEKGEIIKQKQLKAIEKFQDKLVEEKIVGHPLSLVDMVKYLNRQLSENPANYKLPDNDETIAQSLLLYEMDEKNRLAEMTNKEYSEIRITGSVKMLSSKDYEKILNRVTKVFDETIDKKLGLSIAPQGYIPLYVVMIKYITESQLESFASAFLLIFIALFLCFRNYRTTLIAVLPNLLPVSLVLICMYVFNIPLDNGTAIISAIILGVSVDNTIHFLVSYMTKTKEGMNSDEAVNFSLNTFGNAMMSISFTHIAGFLIISLSSLTTLHNFGILCAASVFAAMFGDLLVLPTLLKTKTKTKTKIKNQIT